jgi:prepilin-type N-terminal cleavage/methylation domain-containing protein
LIRQVAYMVRERGFTLAEVLLAVAIIGILMAVALPRVRAAAVGKYRAKGVAQRIVADLRYCRALAVTGGVDHLLAIYPADGQYRIYRDSVDPDNQIGQPRLVDERVTLSGDTLFVFEPGGNAAAGTGTALSVAEGNFRWNISVVVPTGRASMQEQ